MTVAQLTCTHCSAEVENVDRFCRDCGTRLLQRSRGFSSVLLEQRRADDTHNPLLKAEVILVCALITFVVTAVAWTYIKQSTAPNTRAVAAAAAAVAARKAQAVKVKMPVVTPVNAIEHEVSEMDRLFQMASTAPALAPKEPPLTTPVKANVDPKVEAQAPVQEAKPAPVVKPVAVVKPAPKPVVRSEHVDDVAEYNRRLSEFFSRKKTAASDTTFSITDDNQSAAEPPSYEEWMGAGKPNF